MNPVFRGPAPGLAGDRGGDLAGAAPSGAQRSDLHAGRFAKRTSFTRSVKEYGPAVPGHGKGPPRDSAGNAGLTMLRDGSPTGARRWAFDSGSTRSATARPRAAGTRPGAANAHDAKADRK